MRRSVVYIIKRQRVYIIRRRRLINVESILGVYWNGPISKVISS